MTKKEKMIKIAKYAVKLERGWVEPEMFYKNDEEFKKLHPRFEFKRLEYTEIEVEDC